MLFYRKHLCDSDETTPPTDTSSGSTPGKWHKSPIQPFINIWNCFQLLFTVVYLHHLITYSSTKYMGNAIRTISTLNQFTHFPPQAVYCITTPRYYFQGTTFIPYWIFISYWIFNTTIEEAGDSQTYPPSWHIWWPRPLLHKVNWMQLSRQWTVRCTPLQASGGQDQYYVRSTWYSAECNLEGSGQSDIQQFM